MIDFKKIITAIVLLFGLSGISQDKISVDKVLEGAPLAHFDEHVFKVDVDTVAFKTYIAKHISYKEQALHFDRVEIREKLSIGNEKKQVYFIMLTDLKRDMSVSRILIRTGNTLSLSNKETREQIYLACESCSSCEPNFYIANDSSGLICGEETVCVKPGEKLKCPGSKSIIF